MDRLLIHVYRIKYRRLLRALCGILFFELLFLEHVNGIFDSFLKDMDLAKIAFSCHFALNLLCYKEEMFVSTR